MAAGTGPTSRRRTCRTWAASARSTRPCLTPARRTSPSRNRCSRTSRLISSALTTTGARGRRSSPVLRQTTTRLSYDDGDRWQPLRLGLPDTQVSDIWVEANDVVIATHGRGFYVLDDLGALRQYGPAVTTAADAYLFKPGDAIRSGGPARIAYWLKKPAQKLTLEILDPSGQVVRTFNGALPKPDGR